MAKYQPTHAHSAGPRRPVRAALLLIIATVLIVGAALAVKVFVLDKERWGTGPESGAALLSADPSGVSAPEHDALPTPSPEPTPEPTPAPTPVPTPPPIFDDGTDGYVSEGLYIWNNKAFELFYGSTDAAQTYAAAISSYREHLGENIAVYDMVVPNHSEFGLPERIRDGMGCTSQRENTSDVYQALSSGVKAVDIYDNLNLHNDEYLYFNTDTHWAPLGAFYAYETFCEAAGAEQAPLESMKKTTVEGFTGYLAWVTGEDCLYENPDHIDLYEPSCSYTASVSYDGESFSQLDSINSADESMGYSMIIYGDTPLFRVVNHDGTTGRKLALVKDSYGNALAAFLVSSFDEVHVLDFRSFPGNLPAYCEENGITDLLFFNNVMSANTYSQIEAMNELFD